MTNERIKGRGDHSPLSCIQEESFMSFGISKEEILETVTMVQVEKLDIRTITMGINIQDAAAMMGKLPERKSMIKS